MLRSAITFVAHHRWLAGAEGHRGHPPRPEPAVEARLWALVDILGEEKVREDIAYYRQRRAAQRRRRKTG